MFRSAAGFCHVLVFRHTLVTVIKYYIMPTNQLAIVIGAKWFACRLARPGRRQSIDSRPECLSKDHEQCPNPPLAHPRHPLRFIPPKPPASIPHSLRQIHQILTLCCVLFLRHAATNRRPSRTPETLRRTMLHITRMFVRKMAADVFFLMRDCWSW